MTNEIKIYKQGLEQFPKSGIVFGNLMMILWIVLGTLACRFFYPLVAWVYLGFAVLMVYVLLRKLICTKCYYYGKWCPIGWGKCTALLFKKGVIEEFNAGIGTKLAPLTYGLLTLIPLILVVVSIIQVFTMTKTTVLVLLLLISFYSGGPGRKKACARCKMRLFCKGCAAK